MGLFDFTKKSKTNFEELNAVINDEKLWEGFFKSQETMVKNLGVIRNVEYKEFSLKVALQIFGYTYHLSSSPDDEYCRKGVINQKPHSIFKAYKLVLSNTNPDISGEFDFSNTSILYYDERIHSDWPLSGGQWMISLPELKGDTRLTPITIKPNSIVPFGIIVNIDHSNIPINQENYFKINYRFPSENKILLMRIGMNQQNKDKFDLLSMR